MFKTIIVKQGKEQNNLLKSQGYGLEIHGFHAHITYHGRIIKSLTMINCNTVFTDKKLKIQGTDEEGKYYNIKMENN